MSVMNDEIHSGELWVHPPVPRCSTENTLRFVQDWILTRDVKETERRQETLCPFGMVSHALRMQTHEFCSVASRCVAYDFFTLISLSLALLHTLFTVFKVFVMTELRVSSKNGHHQVLKLYRSYWTSSMQTIVMCIKYFNFLGDIIVDKI
jgi:hypothetical protein